jgi:hypothetical protein
MAISPRDLVGYTKTLKRIYSSRRARSNEYPHDRVRTGDRGPRLIRLKPEPMARKTRNLYGWIGRGGKPRKYPHLLFLSSIPDFIQPVKVSNTVPGYSTKLYRVSGYISRTKCRIGPKPVSKIREFYGESKNNVYSNIYIAGKNFVLIGPPKKHKKTGYRAI